jgi:hypothetical protein
MYNIVINSTTYYFKIIKVKKPCTKILINWFLMDLDLTYYTFKIDISTFSAHTGSQTFSISSFDCVFEFDNSYSQEKLIFIFAFFFNNRFKDFEINENGLLQIV